MATKDKVWADRRQNAGRGRRLPIWGLMLFGLVVGAAGPHASAHEQTWNGTLRMLSNSRDLQYTPDWSPYQATCDDRTDGIMAAFVDASDYRGHDVTISMLGGAIAGNATMAVQIETETCGTPGALNRTATEGICPAIGVGSPCTFLVGSNVTTIAVFISSAPSPYGLTGAGDPVRWRMVVHPE